MFWKQTAMIQMRAIDWLSIELYNSFVDTVKEICVQRSASTLQRIHAWVTGILLQFLPDHVAHLAHQCLLAIVHVIQWERCAGRSIVFQLFAHLQYLQGTDHSFRPPGRQIILGRCGWRGRCCGGRHRIGRIRWGSAGARLQFQLADSLLQKAHILQCLIGEYWLLIEFLLQSEIQ